MPVSWKGRAGIFRRDVGDGEHAEVVIEGRVYRAYWPRQIDIAFLSGDTARRELRSSLGRLGALRFLRLRLGLREALEEERDRHAQRLAQPIEATGAHTILALLVFVQVLKRDPQFSRKFWLGYSQLNAPLSHAHPNVNIDRVRPSPRLTTGSFSLH